MHFKVAQDSNISVGSLGSNAHFSSRHHSIAQEVAAFKVCKTYNKHSGARPTS